METMLTRPTLVFIGAACGLMFLLISIHNSRTLNNDLMAKLVETEADVKSVMNNHDACNKNLNAITSEISEITKQKDQLKSDLENLQSDNQEMNESIEKSKSDLRDLEEVKIQLEAENKELNLQLQKKVNIF